MMSTGIHLSPTNNSKRRPVIRERVSSCRRVELSQQTLSSGMHDVLCVAPLRGQLPNFSHELQTRPSSGRCFQPVRLRRFGAPRSRFFVYGAILVFSVRMSDLAAAEVWVFSGARKHFPGGIFTTKKVADEGIKTHRLTGTLTLYPVDIGAYEWALGKGLFKPRKPTSPSPNLSVDSQTPEWSIITTKMASAKADDEPWSSSSAFGQRPSSRTPQYWVSMNFGRGCPPEP